VDGGGFPLCVAKGGRRVDVDSPLIVAEDGAHRKQRERINRGVLVPAEGTP
jgi:hypothetical protein